MRALASPSRTNDAGIDQRAKAVMWTLSWTSWILLDTYFSALFSLDGLQLWSAFTAAASMFSTQLLIR